MSSFFFLQRQGSSWNCKEGYLIASARNILWALVYVLKFPCTLGGKTPFKHYQTYSMLYGGHAGCFISAHAIIFILKINCWSIAPPAYLFLPLSSHKRVALANIILFFILPDWVHSLVFIFNFLIMRPTVSLGTSSIHDIIL